MIVRPLASLLATAALLSCEGPSARPAASPDDIGRAVVEALNRSSAEGLHAIRITREDYLTNVWPRLPESDPKFNFTPEFAWSNLNKRCLVGVTRAISRYGGRDLTFVLLRFEGQEATFPGFTALKGAVLQVKTPEGNLLSLKNILGSVLHEGDRYRLLSYDDG